MTAPHSPLARLLSWLTVTVLLLAGVALPRVSATSGNPPRSDADELAPTCAALDLAQAQVQIGATLAKSRPWADVPEGFHFAVPQRALRHAESPHLATTVPAPRLNLVGIVELRL